MRRSANREIIGRRQSGGVGAWLLILLLAASLGGLVGHWVTGRVVASLLLSDQPTRITLPPVLDVQAGIRNEIEIGVDGSFALRVPFAQELRVPLRQRVATEVAFETSTPLDMTLDYRADVPVKVVARISGRAHARPGLTHREYRNIAFTAEVPMEFTLPVRMRVPITGPLKIRYQGPMEVEIDDIVRVPVDTVIDSHFQLEKALRTPVTSTFGMRLHIPQHPVPITINRARLRAPLRELSLRGQP